MTNLKNSMVFFIAVFVNLVAAAQIIITPRLPAAGLLQQQQLWNLLLVNTSNYSGAMQLQMIMTDMVTGQKIIAATSRSFTPGKGATLIKETDVAPVQYNYFSTTPISGNGSANLLAAGRYMICYTVISYDDKPLQSFAEACEPVEIAPLSPPQLISPPDTTWIETAYPGFAWLPPAPAAMVPQLRYELFLTEMKKGQNAYEAIQKNTPVYMQQYITAPYLLYPSAAPSLEPGKQYAWQVIAKNGEVYAQQTEAWSFGIKNDSPVAIKDTSAYPKLAKGYDAHSYICRGDIKFEYNNEAGDSIVSIAIYEWQNGQQKKVENSHLHMKPGQNFIEMELTVTGKLRHAQVYLLEIINNRKETWNFKFLYLKEE
ncbi:hypothetical protein [Agriterribacter sp.]|uniref:hypothetical protein n=1 Tax=Agriterribacter sp. TaxID=2821509 RepID=UPI002B84A955|nr:hypothetical protein [Agriterribacter sp.]HRO46815.1 hypothetical protein [Agriterribacter sp.]HRQ15576.1 hypothetical protein [Agriterribacter sp.]